jgi:hypothetical protein
MNPPDAARTLLRLLLDDPALDPDDVDWSVLLPTAERLGVMLPLRAWFIRHHHAPPLPLALAFEHVHASRDGVQALITAAARP